MNIAQARERLALYPDDMACAMALWLPDDIKDFASDMDVILSDGRVNEILHTLNGRQDAEYGINWNVIESYIHEH